MVEEAGVEPACLLCSQGASTCLAYYLLSSLKREEAHSLISMSSKIRLKYEDKHLSYAY